MKHQIRIHFADAGFPVVGDPYYNPYVVQQLHLLKSPRQVRSNSKNRSSQNQEFVVNVEMCLHASGLVFPNPDRAIGGRCFYKLSLPSDWNFGTLKKGKQRERNKVQKK